MIYEQSFPRERSSVPAARHFAEASLLGMADEFIATVALLISELATNAVQHAKTSFALRIDASTSRVVVDVSDNGSGGAVTRQPDIHDLSGRGLRVVAMLSDDWGVRPSSVQWQNTVWFSLQQKPSPLPH